MAIWKEQFSPRKDEPATPDPVARRDPEPRADAPTPTVSRTAPRESVISSELTIEGKVEGTGSLRIAGRFKGDVHVQGNLTIEPGATLTGAIRADTVVIAGQLEGNITDATKVELLETGVLNGDVKARSFTVAAGSKMRGQVEFGWDEGGKQKSGIRMESGSAA